MNWLELAGAVGPWVMSAVLIWVMRSHAITQMHLIETRDWVIELIERVRILEDKNDLR